MLFKLILFILLVKTIEINCHARLLVPPARSSAWREDPIRFPVNYDDSAMFCGGTDKLWRVNKGKCGICGEDYSLPKQYEKGGPMYRGFIVRSYTQGQQIEVVVDVTANHYGYFEFRICNVDGLKGDATQKCLDKRMLTDSNDQTQVYIKRGYFGKIKTIVNLPSDLTCKHCVFQWKYNGGNSWNTDPITGQSCVGCGPQEQFYGCADISISKRTEEYKKSFVPEIPNKSDSGEISSEKKVLVSLNLLKRLYAELKRLRELEKELLDNKLEENEHIYQRETMNGNSSDLTTKEIHNEEEENETREIKELRESSDIEFHQTLNDKNALELFKQKYNS